MPHLRPHASGTPGLPVTPRSQIVSHRERRRAPYSGMSAA